MMFYHHQLRKNPVSLNTVSGLVIGYHYCSGIDYKGVKGDYEILKKKFKTVFNSFIEEANMQLEKVKEAWLELIKDKIKNEAKAVSNMESEIEGVEDEESLRALLQQYCFLSNILLLKYLADKLDLTKLKERIDELADERDGFYTSLLAEDFVEIEDHEKMDNHEEVYVTEACYSYNFLLCLDYL